MTISRFAVRRKVTVLMGLLVTILLGIISFTRLPVDLFPQLEQPTAAVMTTWPGIPATEIESSVTRLIEQAVSALPGVAQVRSTSQEGLSVVTVQFAWGTDLNLAALEMRDRVDLTRKHLPTGVEAPTVVKFDPSLLPVMIVAVSGTDQAALRELADNVLRERLERLPGIGAVAVAGGAMLEVAVEVNQATLVALGISQAEVVEAVRAATAALPGGRVTERGRDFIVRSVGQAQDIDQLARVVVGLRIAPDGGSGVAIPVRLMEVADIVLQAGPGATRARLNGQEGIVLTVQKAQAGNAVAISDQVVAELAALTELLPDGAQFEITLNQAAFNNQAIGQLSTSILWGAGLAVLVLAAALLQVGGTITIALAMPVAATAAAMLLYLARGSINLMTLGGFALCTGILLHGSIVVQESISRRISDGELPAEAAVTGAGDVAGPVLTAALATLVVFVPLTFMSQNATSALFRQFALAACCAVGMGLLAAFTLVPAAASVLGRPSSPPIGPAAGPSRTARLQSIMISGLLKNRRLVLGFSLLFLLVSGRAASGLGGEYLPRFDRGEFVITVQMAPGTSIERTDAAVREVESVAMGLAEVRYVSSAIGTSGPLALAGDQSGGASGDVASVAVGLVPASHRIRTTPEVMAEIERLVWLPGARLTFDELSLPPGVSPAMPIQVVLRGPEAEVLEGLAISINGALTGTPGLGELRFVSSRGRPELAVEYSAERLAVHGLTLSDAAAQLRAALTNDPTGRIDVAGSPDVAIVIRSGSGAPLTVAGLGALLLVSPAGGQVRLDEVATIKAAYGTALVERVDGQRAVVLSASVQQRDVASVMADVRSAVARVALPPGYAVDYQGDGAELAASARELWQTLGLGLVLVYVVLAAQMESLLYSLAAMSVVPLAVGACLIGLRLAGQPLSVAAAVGIILLTGVVVSNAVLVVDAINNLRRRGLARDVAVAVASRERLRPVLLSAAASVAALLPLIFSTHEGSELVAPIAITLASGIAWGALLALTVVPTAYAAVDDLASRLFKRPGPDPLDVSDLIR